MNWRNLTSTLPALATFACGAALLGLVVSGAGAEMEFRLGVAFALMATFGVIWAFGMRYPDVGWMVVSSGLLALGTMADAAGPTRGWSLALVGSLRLAQVLALTACLLSFFRAQVLAGMLELAFVAVVAVYFGVSLVLPATLVTALGLGGAAQLQVGAVLFAAAAVHGFLGLAPLPPKRQRFVLAAASACLGMTVCYVVAARSTDAASGGTLFLDFVFAGALAAFLLADLVLFHRDQQRRRPTVGLDAAAQGRRDAQAALGRGVQALLLPPPPPVRFGEFDREFVVRTAPVPGGAWHFVWTSQGEQRLLFGDVSGHGPEAALGVAAVCFFLHEARTKGLSLAAALGALNAQLLTVFARRLTTTAQAVSLALDGTAELYNCGGSGFFTVSRDGGRHWPLNSTPLGVSSVVEVGQVEVPLEDLDLLLAGTAGVAQGSVGVRRLLALLDDEIDLTRLDLATVRDLVVGGSAAVPQTDQTLLIVQRRFAYSHDVSRTVAPADRRA